VWNGATGPRRTETDDEPALGADVRLRPDDGRRREVAGMCERPPLGAVVRERRQPVGHPLRPARVGDDPCLVRVDAHDVFPDRADPAALPIGADGAESAVERGEGDRLPDERGRLARVRVDRVPPDFLAGPRSSANGRPPYSVP
jgi:hypothetical protein